MTIQEAKKFLQERGYYVIDHDALQNIMEIAAFKAIEEYEKRQARNRLYSQKEVAQILKVHQSTISIWIKQGKIKTTPTGKITYQEILRLTSNSGNNENIR